LTSDKYIFSSRLMRVHGLQRPHKTVLVLLRRACMLSWFCTWTGCLGMRVRTQQNTSSLQSSSLVSASPEESSDDDRDSVEVTLELWKEQEAAFLRERDLVVDKILHNPSAIPQRPDKDVIADFDTDHAEVDDIDSAHGLQMRSTVGPSHGLSNNSSVPEDAFCAAGYYCTSGILDERCSSPYTCLPCSLHPDGLSPSGLHCQSCQIDAVSKTTVCLSGVGCPSGMVAVLKKDYDKKHDDKKKRLFCRPDAMANGEMPGLCSANVQGGRILASIGQMWRVRQPNGEWETQIVRFQPYGKIKDGKLPMYLATYPVTDREAVEAAYFWAGSLTWADQAMAFNLGKDDTIGRSQDKACDTCVWRIRDVVEGDEGLEVELEFNRDITNPLLDELVEDPPLVRLSEAAIISLGACMDFMSTGRRPDGISLQSEMLLQSVANIEASKAAIGGPEGGRWRGPETTLLQFLNQVSSGEMQIKSARGDFVPQVIQRFRECPMVDFDDMRVPISFGNGPVHCVRASQIERRARFLSRYVSSYELYYFLKEFFAYTIHDFPELRVYQAALIKSAQGTIPAGHIDLALSYYERMAPGAKLLQELLRPLMSSLTRRYKKFKENAVSGAPVQLHDLLESYCHDHPHGFISRDEPKDCVRNTMEYWGLYQVAQDMREVASASDRSVCRVGVRAHRSEGSSCLTADAFAPTCASGESSWCMQNAPRQRCCCAESGMYYEVNILNWRIRKATIGCVAYRLASYSGNVSTGS